MNDYTNKSPDPTCKGLTHMLVAQLLIFGGRRLTANWCLGPRMSTNDNHFKLSFLECECNMFLSGRFGVSGPVYKAEYVRRYAYLSRNVLEWLDSLLKRVNVLCSYQLQQNTRSVSIRFCYMCFGHARNLFVCIDFVSACFVTNGGQRTHK